MISFYPGPSKVHEALPSYVHEAHEEGILSINHRSDAFIELSTKTIHLLKKKLGIPDSYTLFFTSSATECWEIIAQSLIESQSYHLYNGAFGMKWFQYTQRLRPSATAYRFDREQEVSPMGQGVTPPPGAVLCLTQNETSNATQVHTDTITRFKERYPELLVAVDATSSMGGMALNFSTADVWYASVQKCFGLPAGMAIMACSPKAIELALRVNDQKHYNSLPFMIEKMRQHQTTHTPNVMGIYLLMRSLMDSPPISEVEKKIMRRFHDWISFFEPFRKVRLLIQNERVRSNTVIALTANPALISKIKAEAMKEGFLLGNGYGELKESTFRIANFPALRDREIKALQAFLSSNLD